VRAHQDALLPTRDTAWDSHSMKSHFEAVLRTRSGESIRLDSCRLERFRYREGQRVVALYELRRKDTSQAHAEWVTGVLYPGSKAKRLHSELRDRADRLPAKTANEVYPAAFIDELDMAVQVYPLDRHLNSLERILNEPDGVISRATAPDADAHGITSRWSASLARYRPLQSATFRYSSGDGETAYVKAYREGEDDKPHLRWTSIGTALRDHVGISTPEVMGRDEETGTLILTQARGQSLLDSLRRGMQPEIAGRLAAESLLLLHNARELPLDGEWRPETAIATAKRAAAFLHWAAPQLECEIATAERIALEAPDSGKRGPCHLDAKLDHLFFDGEKPALIDIDTMDVADPIVDIATVAARLQFLHLTESIAEPGCARAARTFVEAYSKSTRGAVNEAFRSHYANAVLQLALFTARHQRDNWMETVAGLLAHAETYSTELSK